MAHERTARKTDEEPAELRPVRFGTLAEPPRQDNGYEQDNGYLPSRDDQSWRELEALGIATTQDESLADIAADEEGELQEDVPESDSFGRGEGGLLFLMFAVGALAMVAFTFPDILTADFWHSHWAAPVAISASPPARVAYTPAPAVRPPPPAPVDDPGVNPSSNAEPAAREQDKLKTMVIAPDGTVDYENAAPAPPPVKHAPSRHKARDRGAGGVYAMAPGPDGVLRYEYFPSAR